MGYGPCVGEVDPKPEDCSTPMDDNCDGQVNEGCTCPLENVTSLPSEDCVTDYGESLWKILLPARADRIRVGPSGQAIVITRRLAAAPGFEPIASGSYPEVLIGRYEPTGLLAWGQEAFGVDVPDYYESVCRLSGCSA